MHRFLSVFENWGGRRPAWECGTALPCGTVTACCQRLNIWRVSFVPGSRRPLLNPSACFVPRAAKGRGRWSTEIRAQKFSSPPPTALRWDFGSPFSRPVVVEVHTPAWGRGQDGFRTPCNVVYARRIAELLFLDTVVGAGLQNRHTSSRRHGEFSAPGTSTPCFYGSHVPSLGGAVMFLD